ncbi:MAG: hypothetical protein ACXVBJ_02880 [Flavisolibacter sp.]
MKPTLSKLQQEHEKCDPPSCPNCENCRVINIEDRGGESKASSPQLYAKEAENYFFYYALNMKQSS